MNTIKNLSLAQISGICVAFTLAFVAFVGTAHADVLLRQLDVGSRGSDVSSLQTFLAADVTLYPQGLVTGFFGNFTSAAVSRFQSRNGLPAVGRVGPMTLPVLNAQMAGGTSNNGSAPFITSAGVTVARNSATVNWITNEGARGVVYYSTSPLATTEHLNSVDVSGNTAITDTNLRTSQSVVLSGLSSNTTYYFLVYTTDQDGNVSVSWPSTFQTTI